MWFIMFYFCNTTAISMSMRSRGIKNATHWNLQWYSSCCLMHQLYNTLSKSAASANLNLCWKGAFILFYLWTLMWCLPLYQVSRCESANKLTCSRLFLLKITFSKFTSSNNYRSTGYCVGKEASHARAIWAQCKHTVTGPVARSSF